MLSSGLFIVVICAVWFLSFYNSRHGRSFHETPFLWPLGIFVWGDGLIIAPFWIVVLFFTALRSDLKLFFVFTALFWVVRSLGEVTYWFNQQFSTIERNKPERMLCYNLVKNDSVWYLYQLFWQCMVVVSVVITLYTTTLWIRTL